MARLVFKKQLIEADLIYKQVFVSSVHSLSLYFLNILKKSALKIDYQKFILENGLKIIVHQDRLTPIVAFNILYDVGARDENEEKTGFAHLFEHLMFGGSVNIPEYDSPLQYVGGENNAFTSNDLTNYYISLPKENIETAFWLESDRMLGLAFTEKSLEVQRNVVIEEFKQRYLNQPYGDVFLLLRPLAYQEHPYKWPTIGKEISHIENASLQDVKDFFYRHYRPNNAILSIAGDVKVDEIKSLAKKYFASIPAAHYEERKLPIEPKQLQARSLTVERDVPLTAIYKAYHMPSRKDDRYQSVDLLSDILARGDSSRLNQKLVKELEIFADIHAYVTGDIDEGLFIISGKINEGMDVKEAEKHLLKELEIIRSIPCNKEELFKVKNKMEAAFYLGQTSVLNKAMSLAIAELVDSAEMVNTDIEKYLKLTEKDIQSVAEDILQESNCSTLYYLAKKND